MEIQINSVEGKTSKKGAKQGQLLFLTKKSGVKNFYTFENSKGKLFTIWNYNGDWSKIGIKRHNIMRYSYTDDFSIINPC